MSGVTFSSRVERLEGGMRFHVIPIPEDIAESFRSRKLTRVIATIQGQPIRRAIIGSKEIGPHLVLGRPELKSCGIAFGHPVTVRLEPDPEPEAIELTEEFLEVLAQDEAARERWEGFTVGRRRSLAVYLTGVKRPESRLRRALEIAEKLRTHTLYGDQPPRVD
ncbi:MAG: DUF1905 domain-containing protein [Verrucomicrobiae bacterium]|nr:DUF1905 domain-containing protein [Verrucomicrobiae bacterium]MCB1090850.1 DUF1905 domain-containing protein [Verrucomicrobiae bacterium]